MADRDPKSRDGAELADVIGKLRDDLIRARGEGEGKQILFELGPVEVTLSVTVTSEGTGKAGVRFWVVDAGVEGRIGRARGQEIKLTLIPKDAQAPTGPDGLRRAAEVGGKVAPDEAAVLPPRKH